MVDVWQVIRGGIPYSEVAVLPARYVFVVELDDAPDQVVGTLLEDTLVRRRWGVQILSEEFRSWACNPGPAVVRHDDGCA